MAALGISDFRCLTHIAICSGVRATPVKSSAPGYRRRSRARRARLDHRCDWSNFGQPSAGCVGRRDRRMPPCAPLSSSSLLERRPDQVRHPAREAAREATTPRWCWVRVVGHNRRPPMNVRRYPSRISATIDARSRRRTRPPDSDVVERWLRDVECRENYGSAVDARSVDTSRSPGGAEHRAGGSPSNTDPTPRAPSVGRANVATSHLDLIRSRAEERSVAGSHERGSSRAPETRNGRWSVIRGTPRDQAGSRNHTRRSRESIRSAPSIVHGPEATRYRP